MSIGWVDTNRQFHYLKSSGKTGAKFLYSSASSAKANSSSSNDNNQDNFQEIPNELGIKIVQGKIGWINSQDLRVIYQESDVVKDKAGNFVPKPVEDSAGEMFEADLKPGQENIEHWAERSTCYLSVNQGACLLGAAHAGYQPKVICKNGDLWQAGSKSKLVKQDGYEYFQADSESDLAILVEQTDKGYQKTIEWLTSVFVSPTTPFNALGIEKQINKGASDQLRIVTNRLPGTRIEFINNKAYDKVRNHTQDGQAALIEGQIIGADQDGQVIGIIKRDASSKAVYHGTSGSPILLGKNGLVSVMSSAELYFFNLPKDLSPEEIARSEARKELVKQKLKQKGLIKTSSDAELKEFMSQYNIINVTPLTKEMAGKLLNQVQEAYTEFRKQQWQNSMNEKATNSSIKAA
jgi:hypothetical protein